MRVNYQFRYVNSYYSEGGGGTAAHRLEFLQQIVDDLIEMGAPLNPQYTFTNTVEGSNYAAIWVPFSGYVPTEPYSGPGLSFEFEPTSTSDSDLFLSLEATGDYDEETENYFYSPSYFVGKFNSSNWGAGISIHAIKSGDSFFFGLTTYGEACINYAITPMRRMSNPDANLGYGVVLGCCDVVEDAPMPVSWGNKIVPIVEGKNYYANYSYPNSFIMPEITFLPETITGKIPMIPLHANVEDVYYEKVYITPMRRTLTEEKAFETDGGVFLIGGENEDWTEVSICQLAFDITDAVNNAE